MILVQQQKAKLLIPDDSTATASDII